MTIAIVGPEKFAFQDLVCVELALTLRGVGLESLWPELAGGEDATLIWSAAHTIQTLEVQVKGAAGALTVSDLAQHLAHYPDRKAEGSLLERLASDQSPGALFVVSGRCEDQLAELLHRGPLASPPVPRVATEGLAEALAAGLAEHAAAGKSDDTKLRKERLKDMAKLATLPRSQLRDALSRVFIIDREGADTVEVRLHAQLRAARFDTLSLRGAIAVLTDEIAAAKRGQRDALAPLLTQMDALAPAAVAPASYLDRGDEAILLAEIQASGALLLAGPPRAGKSWTQRTLGGELQGMGYEVRQGSHVDEAERFLTNSAGAERVYLLDDPLGSREPIDKVSCSRFHGHQV